MRATLRTASAAVLALSLGCAIGFAEEPKANQPGVIVRGDSTVSIGNLFDEFYYEKRGYPLAGTAWVVRYELGRTSTR